MKKYYISLFITSLFVLFSNGIFAKDLPVLEQDKKIAVGTLGNGISYYIAPNSIGTGMVDIALVQNVGKINETPLSAGEVAVRVMGALDNLPHFQYESPFDYMQDKCIWPGKCGYAKVDDNSTVFRFRGLNKTSVKEIVDSTLLMVFDIIGSGTGYLNELYVPKNQAVIVVGDVDTKAVLNKMNMLSLLVSKKPIRHHKSKYTYKYKWESTKDLQYISLPSSDASLASVSAEYLMPRFKRAEMNTVLPLVTSRYFTELDVLLERRLKRELFMKNIPIASMDLVYRGSDKGAGNESYKITLNTDRSHLEKVTEALATVLAELDEKGIVSEEYSDIITESLSSMKHNKKYVNESNEYYMNACIASFLYGSSLASPGANLHFFTKRDIDVNSSVKLFNNFVSSILDKSENLTITCKAVDAEKIESDLLEKFTSSWVKTAHSGHYKSIIANCDTSSLKLSRQKVKLKVSSPDIISGGQVWTFSNGIKVIYKQMPSMNGMFYYSWLIKEGYSRVNGIKNGEGAYLNDMFKLYKISGMSSSELNNMLSSNGIKMICDVSPSDCFIRGYAPSSKLNLLLKSLNAIANDRKCDVEAYKYYKECEILRHKYLKNKKEYKMSVLDSIMLSNNPYTKYKRLSVLKYNIQSDAEKFYSGAFSKMNDGVFILVGDINENTVKKVLLRSLGGFKTEGFSFYRSRMKGNNISGRNTYNAIGINPSLCIHLSAKINQTAENYIASKIAGKIFADAVCFEAAKFGWYVEPKWYFTMSPDESFDVDLYLSKASYSGLPASMVISDSTDEVLSAVHRAISKVKSGASKRQIDAEKNMILAKFDEKDRNPLEMCRMIEYKYAYGKDILTNYKSRIKAVNEDVVDFILRKLADGCIAEYVESSPVMPIMEAPIDMPILPNIPPIRPVDEFTYPFDGMKVPLDTTLGIEFLRSLPFKPFVSDTLRSNPIDTVKVVSDTTMLRSVIDTAATHVIDTTVHKSVADTSKISKAKAL